MPTNALAPIPVPQHGLTRRDLVRPLFRHHRRGLLAFLGAALIVAVVVWLFPDSYQAEMKILVKRDRVEGENGVSSAALTDNEINSEVALLTGREMLRSVAVNAGLAPAMPARGPEPKAVSKAIERLRRKLKVGAVRRSAIIEITYKSHDPATALRVLSTLGKVYLERHLQVFGTPGAYSFFTEQTGHFRDQLQAAQARLLEFGEREGVVAASSEKASTIGKLTEFKATLEQLRAGIADAGRRLGTLNDELAATPERQVTQQRTEENPNLLSQLGSKVLELELRHTEMARKFAPTYPPAVELEQQLAQARAALAQAEQAPMRNVATDQNPTHQWLRTEIARVQADREALSARARATADTIKDYERQARVLDEKDARQQELLRAVKSAEDNYLLYQRKAEEARISEALDKGRIANVAIAQNPTVPAIPATRRVLFLVAGLLGACLLGVAVTFVLEYLDPRFRTRSEVEQVLELPVLAAIPSSITR